MVRKEVISIHIGQCGLQIGTAIWELFLMEHNINIEGKTDSSFKNSEAVETFFHEVNDFRYVPRAMLVDSESNVIGEIRTGVFRNLFDQRYCIEGVDDGANNFARGSFCLGKKLLMDALQKVRRLVENCETLQGFILYHSICGGTGSGLTSVVLHSLMMDYEKKSKFQIPILPGDHLNTSVVDSYNSALHIHSSMDSSDMAILIDNESLYNMSKKMLLVYSPSYIHINRIIAVLMSSWTCSMRFGGPFKTDFVDIGTNLIPYPRVHFPVIAHAPIINELYQASQLREFNHLVKQVFSKDNLCVNINLSRGTYMSVMLNARGDVPSTEIGSLAYDMKINSYIKFVEWSPKGYKICINPTMPMVVPGSGMGATDNSLTMLCNNTALQELWLDLGRKFDLLFSRKAYLHWYIDEGMEENEFMEARLDLAMLWEDYEEISMTTTQIQNALRQNPTKLFRYKTTTSEKTFDIRSTTDV